MILVIGTGRSGTSTVAKLLHEHGISMGNSFNSSTQHEDGCNYEDLECKKINTAFLEGKTSYNVYIRKLCKYGKDRDKQANGIWGVKHPAITYVLGIYLQVFDPVIINCTRDRDSVVKSVMRCYNWTREESEHLYDYRTIMLETLLSRIEHLAIDFTERLSDDYIWEQIEGYLWSVSSQDKDCPVISGNPQRA